MATQNNYPEPNALLATYMSHISDVIYKQIMADVRPKVEEYVRNAAVEATKNLEGAIRERYEHLTRDWLLRVELTFNGEEVKK